MMNFNAIAELSHLASVLTHVEMHIGAFANVGALRGTSAPEKSHPRINIYTCGLTPKITRIRLLSLSGPTATGNGYINTLSSWRFVLLFPSLSSKEIHKCTKKVFMVFLRFSVLHRKAYPHISMSISDC